MLYHLFRQARNFNKPHCEHNATIVGTKSIFLCFLTGSISENQENCYISFFRVLRLKIKDGIKMIFFIL